MCLIMIIAEKFAFYILRREKESGWRAEDSVYYIVCCLCVGCDDKQADAIIFAVAERPGWGAFCYRGLIGIWWWWCEAREVGTFFFLMQSLPRKKWLFFFLQFVVFVDVDVGFLIFAFCWWNSRAFARAVWSSFNILLSNCNWWWYGGNLIFLWCDL